MKRTFITLVLLTGFFLFSCKQNQSSREADSTKNNSTPDEQIIIGTFSTTSPEIEGASCHYSNDETEFKSGKYIFAYEFGEDAFISINGIMTKVKPNKSGNIFVNDNYQISIDTKKVEDANAEEGDEVWKEKGTIKIKRKDGKEIIKNIYGECGD